MSQIEITLKEIEVMRLNPQPGETLLFKFIGDDFDESAVSNFRQALQKFFPNNRIAVMAFQNGNNVELTTVVDSSYTEPEPVKDCSVPTSYCNDCGCGKKERIERSKKG
jgi:hypothetical protein